MSTEIQGSVTVGDQTVYPNSINNFRNMLESIKIQGTTVKVDEFMMPKFMRTVQNNNGSSFGFILAVPLCYTKPNNGETIKKRIAASGFDFKELDFTVDRLIVEDNLTSEGNKYLIFPKQSIQGTNPAESLSYIIGPDGQILYTEDGIPLNSEL